MVAEGLVYARRTIDLFLIGIGVVNDWLGIVYKQFRCIL